MEEPTSADVDRRMDALLAEAEAYFMGQGGVHDAAAEIGRRLGEAGIDYAIAGALALGEHGFRRLTTDVDVLITREGLARFKTEWLGRGYVEKFPGSRGLRDTEFGVRIEFLVSGEFPGDGKPKPVAFPEPEVAFVEVAGARVVGLAKLVELKLISGGTPGRRKDLGDVQELIKRLRLTAAFEGRLHPSVRENYRALWAEAQDRPPSGCDSARKI